MTATTTDENGWTRRRRHITGQIESTGIELFAERGYHNVNLADIADAVGMSMRTVARYFPHKEDILLARQRLINEIVRNTLVRISPGPDVIRAIWTAWEDLIKDRPGALPEFAVWRRAAASAPEVMARAEWERQQGIRATLTTLCAASLDCDPDSDVRPHVLAAMLDAANRAIVLFWQDHAIQTDIGELFGQAEQLVGATARDSSA